MLQKRETKMTTKNECHWIREWITVLDNAALYLTGQITGSDCGMIIPMTNAANMLLRHETGQTSTKNLNSICKLGQTCTLGWNWVKVGLGLGEACHLWYEKCRYHFLYRSWHLFCKHLHLRETDIVEEKMSKSLIFYTEILQWLFCVL